MNHPRDASSKGRHVQGTQLQRDVSSKGRLVQGTPNPRDASSKVRLVQGTHHPRDFSCGDTPFRDEIALRRTVRGSRCLTLPPTACGSVLWQYRCHGGGNYFREALVWYVLRVSPPPHVATPSPSPLPLPSPSPSPSSSLSPYPTKRSSTIRHHIFDLFFLGNAYNTQSKKILCVISPKKAKHCIIFFHCHTASL